MGVLRTGKPQFTNLSLSNSWITLELAGELIHRNPNLWSLHPVSENLSNGSTGEETSSVPATNLPFIYGYLVAIGAVFMPERGPWPSTQGSEWY